MTFHVRTIFFSLFRFENEKFSVSLQTIFRRAVQNAFYESKEFFREKFTQKKLLWFSDSDPFFGEHISARLPKLLSTCSQRQSEEKQFFEGNLASLSFSDFERECFPFLAKNFKKVIKTAFYMPR